MDPDRIRSTEQAHRAASRSFEEAFTRLKNATWDCFLARLGVAEQVPRSEHPRVIIELDVSRRAKQGSRRVRQRAQVQLNEDDATAIRVACMKEDGTVTRKYLKLSLGAMAAVNTTLVEVRP